MSLKKCLRGSLRVLPLRANAFFDSNNLGSGARLQVPRQPPQLLHRPLLNRPRPQHLRQISRRSWRSLRRATRSRWTRSGR